MPRHQQVTTCRKSGGPVSKLCTCEHCTLSVCSVCGAYEGGLTTDCPGKKVDFDKQQEVHETNLDYTDGRGWHLADPTKLRWAHFATTRLPPASPPVDPRTVVAPGIDWTAVDRTSSLQRALSQKAIAWVLADRACDAQSARLARVEDEFAGLRGKWKFDEQERVLLAKLESEKIDFQRACRSVERCDDEFKQAARQLVAAMEERALVLAPTKPATRRSRPCPLALPLNTDSNVLPGQSAQITVTAYPQRNSFWPYRLVIKNADHWEIDQCFVGNWKGSEYSKRPLLKVELGPYAGADFSLDASYSLVASQEVLYGEDVVLVVRYTGKNEQGECFEAVVFGWEERPPTKSMQRPEADE